MEKIIKELSIEELVKISYEVNMQNIKEDALIRKVCSKIYEKNPQDITFSQMLMIMPVVAKELAEYVNITQ